MLSVAFAVLALLGIGAWMLHADRVAADDARELAAAATAVDELRLPASFTPVACDGGMVSYDRCYRADALPQAAVAMAARTLEGAGIRELTYDCPSSPSWHEEPLGCSATSKAVVVAATRDVNPDWTSKADMMASTSTVAIAATAHLDD